MAATPSTGFDEPVRPEDVAVEEALAEVDEDEDVPAPRPTGLPDEADEADVLEQREEVPPDEDDELRDL